MELIKNEYDEYENPVKVKHLIAYLSRFDPETEVELDKDGWMLEEGPFKDEVDIIAQRGLFSNLSGTALFINN